MQRGWRKFYKELDKVAKTEPVLDTGDQMSPPVDVNAPKGIARNQSKWPSTGNPDRTGSPQNLGMIEDGGGQSSPKG